MTHFFLCGDIKSLFIGFESCGVLTTKIQHLVMAHAFHITLKYKQSNLLLKYKANRTRKLKEFCKKM